MLAFILHSAISAALACPKMATACSIDKFSARDLRCFALPSASFRHRYTCRCVLDLWWSCRSGGDNESSEGKGSFVQFLKRRERDVSGSSGWLEFSLGGGVVELERGDLRDGGGSAFFPLPSTYEAPFKIRLSLSPTSFYICLDFVQSTLSRSCS